MNKKAKILPHQQQSEFCETFSIVFYHSTIKKNINEKYNRNHKAKLGRNLSLPIGMHKFMNRAEVTVSLSSQAQMVLTNYSVVATNTYCVQLPLPSCFPSSYLDPIIPNIASGSFSFLSSK